ncbi:MAG: sugar phosphate isomerase/epimerase family protein [Verrucomicrobiota bacterium]
MTDSIKHRLAVCSWSLQPASPAELFSRLATLGLYRVQCALDPILERPDVWKNFGESCKQEGVTLVSGMFGTAGEDYTTLETIRLTGGLVPDATWGKNWKHIQAAARLADELGMRLVSFHAGFLPHEESDPDFHKLKQRLQQVAEEFAARNIELALETGQETAETLRSFLEKLGCPNVGVNFDPANMILYGKGDPIEAMRVLGPWIRQVHIKDAKSTLQPGTWGEEVVAGTGEVDWKAFFSTLETLGFQGDCCIEREAGQQRAEDIRAAKSMVESLAG